MVGTLETRALIEAEPEQVGLSSKGLANVTRLVQGYVDGGRYAGALSLVARRGKVVHAGTYGLMDVAAGEPMRPDTIFRIYSMSKPIASVALMMLYEEGRFQLDDPASKFIPEWKGLKVRSGGTDEAPELRDPAREISVRDLLMHMSGLQLRPPTSNPGAAIGQMERSQQGRTLADTVRDLSTRPLLFDPGSRWSYGISTDIVGYLCEVLSGQNFDQYLRERIFEPLGMTDSGFTVRPSEIDRFAACYRRGQDGEPAYVLQDAPADSVYVRPRTYFSGAGGMVSTASDYLRFCKMLAGGGELDGVRILGSRTVAFMASNHLPGGQDLTALAGGSFNETSVDGIGFGLGFAVLENPQAAQLLGTPGEYYWGGAASTAFFINPAEELIMIFLTQLLPSSAYPIRRELRSIIYSSIID